VRLAEIADQACADSEAEAARKALLARGAAPTERRRRNEVRRSKQATPQVALVIGIYDYESEPAAPAARDEEAPVSAAPALAAPAAASSKRVRSESELAREIEERLNRGEDISDLLPE
jgi:hypothetical protein